MTARKRTRAEREQDLVEIAALMAQGKSARQIAEIINPMRRYNLSRQTYTSDMRTLRKRWRDAQQREVEDWIAEALNQFQQTIQEAWAAWNASWHTKDGPDPRFLEIIGKTVGRRIKLLGIDKPTKVEISWREEAKAAGIAPQRLFEAAIDRYIEFYGEGTRPALPGSTESSETEDPPGGSATIVDAQI